MAGFNNLCRCRRVDQAKIEEAIKAGASTVDEIRKATNAGTGCGRCINSIRKVLEENK